MNSKENTSFLKKIQQIHHFNQYVAAEKNHQKLLETILDSMRSIVNADGGVLYLYNKEQQKLKFEILQINSLGIKMGGSTQIPVPFDDLPIFNLDGEPSLNQSVCYSIIKDEIINLNNIYRCLKFDFSRIRKFDKLTQYKTKSLLTVPIKNDQNEIIGVFQFINALNENGEVISFCREDEVFAQFMSSWAAIILTHFHLNQDLKKLFESVVQVLASAIDDKSAYTGGHCRRVPVIAMMIADALSESQDGPFEQFHLSPEERYELELAALLHDCGKVTTPVHIMDKATKLETIFDRIELIDYRFEILKRDEEIAELKEKIKILEHRHHNGEHKEKNDKKYKNTLLKIEDDQKFLHKCNIGGEFMTEEEQERVKQIGAKYTWINIDGVESEFLNYDEIRNLIISRGTLNSEEREIINHHADMTYTMLKQMHFPQHLKRIPEIASCHHEKINGKGYPRGIRGEEMSVQARLMGIADIFEALTAKDRPYKRGKTLSESLFLMGKMRLDQHIDGDIFDLFIDQKLYLEYAKKYLDEYQIDYVDVNKIPGYLTKEKRKSQKIERLKANVVKAA